MKKTDINLVIIAVALVAVLTASGICYNLGYQSGIDYQKAQQTTINSLPECGFSLVFQLEGQNHIGYWVETSPAGETQCIVRFDQPGNVVDEAL